MDYKLGERIDVVVHLQECNFDRACKKAYREADRKFGGFEEDGHLTNVDGFERSCCDVRVRFLSYEHVGCMAGHTFSYIFEAWTVGEEDEDE